MVRRKQSNSNAMDKVLYHFLSKTESLFEMLDEDENNDIQNNSPATEVLHRFQLYLSYTSRERKTDVRQYLIDEGYSKVEVEGFLNRCSKNQSIEADFQEDCEDEILEYFKTDFLQLLNQVYADSNTDPHYSAVTAERRILLYLECKDFSQSCSVTMFLLECGYSQVQVDIFYEKYRRECLRWYNGEPREPIYANGKLRAYEVEGMFVVGIREVNEKGYMAPRGAEFDSARNCIWTYELTLLATDSIENCLHKDMHEIEQNFGSPSVLVAIGERKDVPAYITNHGYLACLIFAGNRVAEIQLIDLCTAY